MVKQATIRLIVTVVLMANALLTAKGYNPIPFDDNELTEILTQVAAFASAIWAWWKNNNVTESAQEAQLYLNKLKDKEDGELW